MSGLIYPGKDFYLRDVREVAPALVGKLLIRTLENDKQIIFRITETEAYCGVSDTACHAFRGKTARNQLLWCEGGTIYVYLCYGIHHMLNIITGNEGDPQGVLIRACEGYAGPGRLTRKLEIDKSLNGESIIDNPRLAIADDGTPCRIRTDRRVGIDYASPADRAALLRFIAEF